MFYSMIITYYLYHQLYDHLYSVMVTDHFLWIDIGIAEPYPFPDPDPYPSFVILFLSRS